MDRPGIPKGLLVGALLTAPLIAVFYLVQQLTGLPFVPFDVFDWMARVLPGAVITFGIDTIVAVIRRFGLGEISEAAKTAEQALAIAGLFVTGTVAGGVLFGVLRRRPARSGLVPGLIVGALIGVPAALIEFAGSQTATVGPVIGGVWVLIAFLAWGALMGWTYDRLSPARGAGNASQGSGAVGPGTRAGRTVEPSAATVGRRRGPGFEGGPQGTTGTVAAENPSGSRSGVTAESRAHVESVDRRRFLIRLGGASAAITIGGATLGAAISMRRELEAMRARGAPWSATHPLPNANADVVPPQGTRSELTPVDDHYRIDINTIPPRVNESNWRLRFGGLVGRPLEFTLADLRGRYPSLDQFITLSCISNPIAGDLIGTTRWTGVSVQRLLDEVQPRSDATHLRIRSVDDFFEVVALDEIRADPRIMLTYAWDGLPLLQEHGFPLRIYIPDRYGMKQPKWIDSIEAIPAFEPGYWVQRGWDREARMRTTSVIDVVASNMMIVDPRMAPRDPMVVPLGGMAHAGARGISRVEVRVDNGAWEPAQLREPLSELTWVLWRFDWPFQPGDHTFTVRCFDGTGAPQIAEPTPVRPAGATGLHSTEVML